MNTFQSFERATIQWLVRRYQRHTLNRAATRAYRNFARQHPQWVAALFDEHFIFTHVLPLLQKAASTGEKVTPMQVAEIWAKQISVLPKMRQNHTARMTPIAGNYLSRVTDELAETPVSQVARMLVETTAG